MLKTKRFRVCAFPSDIHVGERYPIEVTFPDSVVDRPQEGEKIKRRLPHTPHTRVPTAGWCLVVQMTARVRDAPFALCPDMLPALGHECGVVLDKPRFASGRLSTHISFAKKIPLAMTPTDKVFAQPFLQLSICKDAKDVYTTTPIPLFFRRTRHRLVRTAVVKQFFADGKGGVYITFFETSPTLDVPYVTAHGNLLTSWVKDPVRELSPTTRVSFRYDPLTGAVVSPITMSLASNNKRSRALC